MAIDDLLNQASDVKHAREGLELHRDVLDTRIPLLEQYFKDGLSTAERTAFEALSPMERVAKLRENNYKLKPELADKLIRYVAVQVVKRHDTDLGGILEADFNTVHNNPAATEADKIAAVKRINMFKPMLDNLGFDMTRLELIGKERGFGAELWQQLTQALPQRYQDIREEAITSMIPEAEAHGYLTGTIAPATGIKADIVKGKGLQEVRSVLADFARYRRQSDLAGFQKQYHQYHT